MTATQNIIRRLAIAAAGAAALAAAGSASALPIFPPPNFPPVANFTIDRTPALIGQNVVFDADSSVDRDGDIVKYEWDLNNDGIYEVRSTAITVANRVFATPGTHPVRLRVTDNRSAKSVSLKQVLVHQRPVALLSADRAVPNVGDVVGYRATGSYDPDGNGIIGYRWDRDGDGTFEFNSGTNPFIQTSFATPGAHRLSVIVVDGLGASSLPTTLNVRVNKRPTAVISATPNPAVVNQQVMLSGAGSTDDRAIVKYEWDLDGNGTYETNTGTNAQTAKMFTTLGQAKVGLQVTDNDGAMDQSTATIQVNAAPVRDTTAPKVRISPASVRMREGFATFKVTCPATEMSCATRFTLTGRTGALRGKALGRTTETVPGGETSFVFVPLSSKAIRTIRRSGRISATATAVATDAAGNTGTTRKVVTIRK